MTDLAMFPLGSVLFPHMPLHLRVFEERYLVMLSNLLESDGPEFGVVLIERGQEVGGGEQRFAYGTRARIIQLAMEEGFVGLVAVGTGRFEVIEWLEEDPNPCAVIRELAELEWHDDLLALRIQAEVDVRRALAVASEFTEQQWASTVELSTDRVVAAWQLAAIAPVGPLDQVALLRSTSMRELLESVIELVAAAGDSFDTRWLD